MIETLGKTVNILKTAFSNGRKIKDKLQSIVTIIDDL